MELTREQSKICPRCGVDKPWAEFYSQPTPAGRRPTAYCKPCTRDYTEGRRHEIQKYLRGYRLHQKYGMTEADFAALVEEQGGRCVICPAPPEVVDHDHRTGKVRGLLCQACNKVLGFAKDDPVRLIAAANYLQEG
jgi:hypothetical protein